MEKALLRVLKFNKSEASRFNALQTVYTYIWNVSNSVKVDQSSHTIVWWLYHVVEMK